MNQHFVPQHVFCGINRGMRFEYEVSLQVQKFAGFPDVADFSMCLFAAHQASTFSVMKGFSHHKTRCTHACLPLHDPKGTFDSFEHNGPDAKHARDSKRLNTIQTHSHGVSI